MTPIGIWWTLRRVWQSWKNTLNVKQKLWSDKRSSKHKWSTVAESWHAPSTNCWKVLNRTGVCVTDKCNNHRSCVPAKISKFSPHRCRRIRTWRDHWWERHNTARLTYYSIWRTPLNKAWHGSHWVCFENARELWLHFVPYMRRLRVARTSRLQKFDKCAYAFCKRLSNHVSRHPYS